LAGIFGRGGSPIRRIFQERPIETTQSTNYLWEVEYDIETAEGITHSYATFLDDDELIDEEVIDRAYAKGEENVYCDVVDVRIVAAWHRTL
jgi:hypothetical protein